MPRFSFLRRTPSILASTNAPAFASPHRRYPAGAAFPIRGLSGLSLVLLAIAPVAHGQDRVNDLPVPELVPPIVVAAEPAPESSMVGAGEGVIRIAARMNDDPPSVMPPLAPPALVAPVTNGADAPAEETEDEIPLEAGDDGLSLDELGSFLTRLARRHVPHTFSDNKKWGGTIDRWNGLDFELDGLRLETRRRRKEVNHGNWQRYDVQLLDPDREFVIRLKRLESRADGRLVSEIEITSYVQAHGQFARWNRGVQLISLGVDARARMTLNVVVSLGTTMDFSQLPPAVVLDPVIESSRLTVHDFEVDRIGQVGGDVAEWLGRQSESMLREKVEEQQEKITAKLNRAIDRPRDDLRLSVVELTRNEWGRLVERHMQQQQAE